MLTLEGLIAIIGVCFAAFGLSYSIGCVIMQKNNRLTAT